MTVALFGGSDLMILEGAEVDGRMAELHSFRAQASKFTIENGALSTDHIIEQPDTLTVIWVLSNLDEQGSSYGHRAANVLDVLKSRISNRALYQVVTRHRLYPSMALTEVQSEHTGPFSGALRGRLTFESVNTDLLERIAVPVAKVSKKAAASKVDAGRVQPVEDTGVPTVLKQLLDKLQKLRGN